MGVVEVVWGAFGVPCDGGVESFFLMALSGHLSFLPVVDVCLANWSLANAALPAPGLVLADGSDRGSLVGLRGALAEQLRVIVVTENEEEFAMGSLKLLKPKLLARLGQFNDTVRAWWRNGPMAVALPKAQSISNAVDRFLVPMREALRLWEVLEGRPAPSGVVLPLRLGAVGDFGRGDFLALVVEAEAQRLALLRAGVDLRLARAERDALERRVRGVLVTYAQAVLAQFGAASNITESLPRLSPIPWHTPQAVVLSGVYDAETQSARLEWGASEDPKLVSYQIRQCAGGIYAKKTERVVATVRKDEVLQAVVRQVPGAVMCYKVYVLLSTGNERGSRPVVVTG